MQTLQRNELCADKGCYAVLTRTAVVHDEQLRRIAGHLRSDAENLAFSTIPPAPENCRIARAIVGWAFSLAPMRIDTRFNY